MTVDEAQALQRAYVRQRRAWCRKVCWPIRGHEREPDPAVLDGDDPEEG